MIQSITYLISECTGPTSQSCCLTIHLKAADPCCVSLSTQTIQDVSGMEKGVEGVEGEAGGGGIQHTAPTLGGGQNLHFSELCVGRGGGGG